MKTEGIQYIAYLQVVHTIVFFSVDIDGVGVGVGSMILLVLVPYNVTSLPVSGRV